MPRPTIRLKAGTRRTVRVQVKLPNGAPRDLTGEVVEFRASLTFDGSSLLYKVDGDGIEVVDAATGVIDVVFEHADVTAVTFPELTFWDLRITDEDGNYQVVNFASSGETPQTYGLLVIERPLLAVDA